MIICPRCQAQNSDGVTQCGRCGFSLQMSNYYGLQVPNFIYTQQNPAVAKFNPDGNKSDPINEISSKDQNNPNKPMPVRELGVHNENNKPSIWQIINTVCLIGILLIMIFKTISNLSAQRQTNSSVKEIEAIAKRLKNQSFSDLNIKTVTGEDRPSYYWDLRNSSGSTSYKAKKNLPKLKGNYYLIEGYIDDVYPSGLTKIRVGIRGLDTKYSDTDVSIWVYGFSNDQLSEFKHEEKVQIIVKIVYADTVSSDGLKEDLYSVVGIYVQDA